MIVSSFDVFDTILLRNLYCEKRNFYYFSKLAANSLTAAGRPVSPSQVLRARREAQILSYRALELQEPQADLSAETIAALQCKLLNLPAECAEILAAAELEAECKGLRPNTSLLGQMESRRQTGHRLIAISDTYLSASNLATLFQRVIGRTPVEAIYTSADLGATKRSGKLFKLVLEREGIPAHALFHTGDDWTADVAMPRKAGASGSFRPRMAAYRLARRCDAALFRLKHGAMP
ncbi:MAG: hypothetical protein ACRCWF_05885 [Beijerinckiaceae bacterium]